MSVHHAACRFSITVQTDDLAALHMLRGLCQHCESGRYKQIAWGGTGAKDWRRNGHRVVFRFTRSVDRDAFQSHARLLLTTAWTVVSTDDNDPATPRR
jgi:hypothetical protein